LVRLLKGFPRCSFLFKLRAHTFHVQRIDTLEQPDQEIRLRQAGFQIHADPLAENRGGRALDAEQFEE